MKTKKIVYVIGCLLLALLPGCKTANVANNSSGNIQSYDSNDIQEPVTIEETVIYEQTANIDIDLTTMSGTMVYSEVYNMISEPDQYVGKTVKIEGRYAEFYDENTDTHYSACIIEDATACCIQGLEFRLSDQYAYPEDYPQDAEWITVTGVFDTYKEGKFIYCVLRDANIV